MMYWLCILTIFFISLFSGIFSETEGIYIYIFSFANYFCFWEFWIWIQLNRVELRGCEIKYCDSNKGFGIFYANDASDGK